MTHKHPNEFTRRRILKYFSDRKVDVEVNAIEKGYVIFYHRFSFVEGCTIDDPAGRLVYDEAAGFWRLYWMSDRFSWHLYGRYENLFQALDVMSGDQAPNLFHKEL